MTRGFVLKFKFPVFLILTAMFVLPRLGAVAEEMGAPSRDVILTDEARVIHQRALVVDGHNDLPWALRKGAESSFSKVDISQRKSQFHTDIPRLRQGGVGAQFWSAYVPASTAKNGTAVRMTMEQIDLIHRMVKRYPETFAFAPTADSARRLHSEGKIACMIGVEGGHSIDGSLGVLRLYYQLGVRYMTLTHSDHLAWAASATDEPTAKGLSAFGKEVVHEMNRLGMLVDISHVSEQTMMDALAVSQAPIIASHSSAFGVAAHPRNVPDAVLRKVADNGGVVMVNFFSGFVVPETAAAYIERSEVERRLRREYPDEQEYQAARAKWRQLMRDERARKGGFKRGDVQGVVDHIDHIVQVAGIDHVGLGADYDGVSLLPKQLDDVASYPLITQELLNRGYVEEGIHKILGRNILRALGEAEVVARRMRNGERSQD